MATVAKISVHDTDGKVTEYPADHFILLASDGDEMTVRCEGAPRLHRVMLTQAEEVITGSTQNQQPARHLRVVK